MGEVVVESLSSHILAVETDAIGLQRRVARRDHRGHHGAGVDASREEGADWHVAEALVADNFVDEFAESGNGFARARGRGRGDWALGLFMPMSDEKAGADE